MFESVVDVVVYGLVAIAIVAACGVAVCEAILMQPRFHQQPHPMFLSLRAWLPYEYFTPEAHKIVRTGRRFSKVMLSAAFLAFCLQVLTV